MEKDHNMENTVTMKLIRCYGGSPIAVREIHAVFLQRELCYRGCFLFQVQ